MASCAVLGWLIPSFVGLRARRRRQLARSEAVAAWAEMLRDLLVSNAGLHEAIGKSARVAPAAIRDEVKALYVRTQRGELATALARFADDMDDGIADTVVTALQIADQRAVADLGQMLAAVASSTRETVAMQLRINAARARTYRTAQLIAGIVAFFVGAARAHQPRVHGAVRHRGGAAGARRGRRRRRRGGVGHGRAVAARSISSPAAGRGALAGGGGGMIWAAIVAGGVGAGIWLIARGLAPPARPLRALAGELVAPREALLHSSPTGSVRRWWERLGAPTGRRPLRAAGRRSRRARPFERPARPRQARLRPRLPRPAR